MNALLEANSYFTSSDPVEVDTLIQEKIDGDEGYRMLRKRFCELTKDESHTNSRVQYLVRCRRAIECGGKKGIKSITLQKMIDAFNRARAFMPKSTVLAAAAFGAIDLLKDYNKDGMKLDEVKEQFNGLTPMHYAACYGHGEVVSYLIEQGAPADPIARNPMGWTPLFLAVENNDPQIVKRVLDAGAEINRIESKYGGLSPFRLSCEKKYYRLCLYLLSRGADPRISVIEGKKPLDEVEEGKLETAFTHYRPEAFTLLRCVPHPVRLMIYAHLSSSDDLITHARGVCRDWSQIIIEDLIIEARRP